MIPQQDLRQVEGMNAYFIIPARAKAFASELFMDHPPIEKRLAALAEIAREMGRPVAGPPPWAFATSLFGRKKLSEPKDDRLFALSTAAVTLETELGLKTAGQGRGHLQAALARASSAAVDNDIERCIKAAARSVAGSEVERKTDTFGFEWLIVHDPELEDQVTAVHAVAQELTDQGFGAQLLAAPFLFDGGAAPRLLDLRLQARRVLAVRPDRQGPEARQRRPSSS